MKIKWLKGTHYSLHWGTLKEGEVKSGIPKKVAEKWIDTGYAEEVRPQKKAKKKGSKDLGGK